MILPQPLTLRYIPPKIINRSKETKIVKDFISDSVIDKSGESLAISGKDKIGKRVVTAYGTISITEDNKNLLEIIPFNIDGRDIDAGPTICTLLDFLSKKTKVTIKKYSNT